MGYAIVLYSDSYRTQIGTCFFNGYIDDAYKEGEELLSKYPKARYFSVFETDFYFNTLKNKRNERSKHNNQRREV